MSFLAPYTDKIFANANGQIELLPAINFSAQVELARPALIRIAL